MPARDVPANLQHGVSFDDNCRRLQGGMLQKMQGTAAIRAAPGDAVDVRRRGGNNAGIEPLQASRS
jgi:hypothetical protein